MSRTNCVLDTSIQYEKLKYVNFLESKGLKSADLNLRTSYFILYEYKIGLIKSLIDFYYIVLISTNVQEAFSVWSESFSIRDVKNVLIIQGTVAHLHKNIETDDVKKYAAQVEAAIQYSINIFFKDLDTWIVGAFGSDPVANFQLFGSETFKDFCYLYTNRKSIPMDDFWIKKSKELKIIIANTTKAPKQFKEKYAKLQIVHNNPSKTSGVRLNSALGDPVISVDTPKNHLLATLDEYQCHLRDVLVYPKMFIPKNSL